MTRARWHPFPEIEVLGIPFIVSTFDALVEYLIRTSLEPDAGPYPRRLATVSIPLLVYAQEDPDLRALLTRSFMNLPDGMPAVWVGRWKGARGMEKIRGPSLMARLLAESRGRPVRHYFCGGLPGVAEQLRARAQARWGAIPIVGTYSPPFRPMTEDEVRALAADMDAREADIVWMGISSPKQDRLAERLARYSRRVRYFIPVGGAFDMLSGRVPEAPRWMHTTGLEWFFRMMHEPRRLAPRYLRVIPRFVRYAARDLWTHWRRDRGRP